MIQEGQAKRYASYGTDSTAGVGGKGVILEEKKNSIDVSDADHRRYNERTVVTSFFPTARHRDGPGSRGLHQGRNSGQVPGSCIVRRLVGLSIGHHDS